MKSTKIMRSDDLRVQNRHRVLRTLRNEGPLTRAKIGKKTGLSQAALSTLFGMMTEQGIVTSKSINSTHKRGRPSTTIALEANAGVAVTVALTINHLCVNLVNYAGVTINQTNHVVDSKSFRSNQLATEIAKHVERIIEPLQQTQLKAICIGFQGVTDTSSGELLCIPTNLEIALLQCCFRMESGLAYT